MLERLIRDRRGAVATVIALASPALLGAVGFGTDMGLMMSERAQLQSAADAAATAGRNLMNNDGQTNNQQLAIDEVNRFAQTLNASGDPVVATIDWGWYHRGDVDQSLDREFGPPLPSQKDGTLFANGIKVTMTANHSLVFGPFIGLRTVSLARSAISYKCSNYDYVNIRISDDTNPTPPDKPAIWFAFGTATDPTPHTWVYKDGRGNYHPVYKVWSPTDLQDVSFVSAARGWSGDGWTGLQVDTYCRGTYLVISSVTVNSAVAHGDHISVTTLRGSTNNNFNTFPDQTKYPLATPSSQFSYARSTDIAALLKSYNLDVAKLRQDSYPCGDTRACPQIWYDFLPQKQTDPIIRDGSPERRAVIVADRRDLGLPPAPSSAPAPGNGGGNGDGN